MSAYLYAYAAATVAITAISILLASHYEEQDDYFMLVVLTVGLALWLLTALLELNNYLLTQ